MRIDKDEVKQSEYLSPLYRKWNSNGVLRVGRTLKYFMGDTNHQVVNGSIINIQGGYC